MKELFLCSVSPANTHNCHGLYRNFNLWILLRILTPAAGSFFEFGGGLLNLWHTVGDQRSNTSDPCISPGWQNLKRRLPSGIKATPSCKRCRPSSRTSHFPTL